MVKRELLKTSPEAKLGTFGTLNGKQTEKS
jgi:hypothetical protein